MARPTATSTLVAAFAAVIAAVIAGCATKPSKIDFDVLTKQLLGIIADRHSTSSDLQQAIIRLGAVSENPKFWTTIANDPTYSAQHRQACIMALLQRHGHASGGRLGDLGTLLDRPNWLKDGDVEVVVFDFGPMPVEWTPDDTIILIRVFPQLPTLALVYVKLAGKIDKGVVSRILRGDASGSLQGGELVLDLGFFEREKRLSGALQRDP